MKAIAVNPGKQDSVHLTDVSKPNIDEVADGKGVLVKVLRVGVDATDNEINEAEYGQAPAGGDYLIIGHESFGVVEKVGSEVVDLQPGDYVAATVRRPGNSLYDKIGMYDMTTDDDYFERGINLRHGYLTEYYVDHEDYIVKVPGRCKDVGVLMEPTSIIEKGITQAYEIQRRMKIWQPKTAAVMGTGTLGLLAAMGLRLRGLQVYAFGLETMPYKNGKLIEELGGTYISTNEMSLDDASDEYGPFDIIFEATGHSGVAFQAAENLGKNGVLILSSITGGDRTIEIPSDKINLEFVLGNKVMFGTVNANREHFEIAARSLSQSVSQFPGWLNKLLTHPVDGLEEYEEMMRLLTEGEDVIKAYVNIGTE